MMQPQIKGCGMPYLFRTLCVLTSSWLTLALNDARSAVSNDFSLTRLSRRQLVISA